MKKMCLHLLFLLFFSSFCINFLIADDTELDKVKSKIPQILGANNVGNDFWFTFNPCVENSGANNDVRVFVSSQVRTLVTVEVLGKPYTTSQYTVPNNVIEFRIPSGIAQCYQKGEVEPPQVEKVYNGAGVHVYAEDLIVVYGLTRFQYTSDGFLALPVTALGNEYIVASYADPNVNGTWLPSEVGIVAAYDNTKVRFTLGGTVDTKTYGGMLPGETKEFNMKKGDVLLFAGAGVKGDLSGSKIISNKPVGVLSGNYCAFVPSDKWACDFITEMELPTLSWGNDYHITPIFPRKKNSIIKIFAKEANTDIYRDGLSIGTIATPCGTEGNGWLHIRADEGDPRPIVISGDKPINVTQFNPGIQDDDVDSDPFQLVLSPVQQYQKEVIFNTPGIKGGAGYSDNYVNICYQANGDGSIPDDLMFANVVNGEFSWKSLNIIDSVPGTAFVYNVNNKLYHSKTIILPGDGVYKIKADEPFAAYCYGFSWCDSYGFPAGALTAPSNADEQVPVPKWVEDDKGEVYATVTDYPEDDLIRTNMSIALMHSEFSYNYKFEYETFIPGNAKTVGWGLKVIDLSKDAKAYLSFADRKGNDTTIVIEYKAPVSVDENIEINGFCFKNISPNPVGSSGAMLEFSVGVSEWTEISIFDENGKLIAKPVAGALQPGKYSEPLPLDKLQNGTYICVMSSGKFKQTRKIAVVR